MEHYTANGTVVFHAREGNELTKATGPTASIDPRARASHRCSVPYTRAVCSSLQNIVLEKACWNATDDKRKHVGSVSTEFINLYINIFFFIYRQLIYF
jgi:hypothetical protein